MTEPTVVKSEDEWRDELTPAQYEVLRRAGTEAPFTGERRRIRTFGPDRKARFAGPVVPKSRTCLAEVSVVKEVS